MRPLAFMLALALLAAPAAAQTTLFADDFEQGLGNWSATGQWHALADTDPCAAPVVPFPSGSGCAYFGGGGPMCTFADPFGSHAEGRLSLLQPLHLPAAAAGVVLRFHSREEFECSSCNYDRRWVEVSPGGGPWQRVATGNLLFAWHEKWVDLSAFRGQDVLLRFAFDSNDGVLNDYHGWCVDEVRVETTAAAVPDIYCTAKTSLCAVQIEFAGMPSASSTSPFTLAGRALPRNQPGVLFFGHAGASHPFMGGFLCVQPPTTRTPVQLSGGPVWAWDCTGSYALDFNAVIQGGAHPALAPGAQVHAQYWFRDPMVPFGTGLTDALQFVIGP